MTTNGTDKESEERYHYLIGRPIYVCFGISRPNRFLTVDNLDITKHEIYKGWQFAKDNNQFKAPTSQYDGIWEIVEVFKEGDIVS